MSVHHNASNYKQQNHGSGMNTTVKSFQHSGLVVQSWKLLVHDSCLVSQNYMNIEIGFWSELEYISDNW